MDFARAYFQKIVNYRLPKTATAPFCPSEIEGSVKISKDASTFKKFLAFLGPGLFISIGYIDPGNWATDIEAGSRYGYSLICIILASNIIALFLQTLCVRVGIATRKNLAELCRDRFNRKLNLSLWLLAEIAIVACDLAEVLGTALAFQLLFKIPLSLGVLLTALDTIIVLAFQGKGVRRVEAMMLGFVTTVAISFAVQLWLVQPNLVEIAHGFLISSLTFPDHHSLYLAIGIMGATVMPHNLYLHTSLVQTRTRGDSDQAKKEAIRFSNWDIWISLGLAFLVNAAILILAGTVFHHPGQTAVTEIDDAYSLLAPLVGSVFAPFLFGIALLASGQSSTLTGTIAGQVVLEGFLKLKIPCWQRRLITRALALIPAYIGVKVSGAHALGGLLVLSQVVLSLQLPFAIAPLILFASDQDLMGSFSVVGFRKFLYWVLFGIVTIANFILLIFLFQ